MDPRTATRLGAVCLILFALAGSTIGQTANYERHKGPESYQRNQVYTNTNLLLPDMVVTKIFVPDELPRYSTLEAIDVEIQNVGRGWMKGNLRIDFEIDSRDLSSCRIRQSVGGGFGNPDATRTARSMRYTKIAPGEKVKMTSFISGLKYGLPDICRKPVQHDFKIRVTINPIQGQGLRPRGAILESDHGNNVLEKEIKLIDGTKRGTFEMKFIEGDNFFSVPVVDNVSVLAFMQLTGCDVLDVPSESQNDRRRTLDLSTLTHAPITHTLTAGNVYVARCGKRSTFTFAGDDPGSFSIEILGRRLTAVPSRAGQQGMRAYETLKGCSIARGGGHSTEFLTYVPGNRNIRSKPFPEKVLATSPIRPGLVYLIRCDTTYGGVYDGEDAVASVGERLINRDSTPTRRLDVPNNPRGPGRYFGSRVTGYNYRYKPGFKI